MRFLVTGGAGFIGSNVAKILEDKGTEVVILDDFSHANYENLLDTKAEVICGNILDEKIFDKLPKIDGVIHEAAVTDTTLDDDVKMMSVNYNGFKNILNFCLNKNIRLVYASSAGVYGEGPSPMKEEQQRTPHNIYAYSKYLCDRLALDAMAGKGAPLIVGLRYFNVYGPAEYHKGTSASMIYQLYLQMKQGNQPRVFKSGEQKRDFIYVKDVARITVEAMQLKQSTILNVGTGRAGSFNEIIAALNSALNSDLKPDYFDNPYIGKYQDYTEADVTHLVKTFGSGAQFSLEEGISDYVTGHLSS